MRSNALQEKGMILDPKKQLRMEIKRIFACRPCIITHPLFVPLPARLVGCECCPVRKFRHWMVQGCSNHQAACVQFEPALFCRSLRVRDSYFGADGVRLSLPECSKMLQGIWRCTSVARARRWTRYGGVDLREHVT